MNSTRKNMSSRILVLGLAIAACSIGACAAGDSPTQAVAREILAPSGKLRMGLYPGTPTSILPDAGAAGPRGVGYDLGRSLARDLGVPFEPVVLANNAEVLEAVKAGTVDLAFTNATAERTKEMDFSPVCLVVELGFLVREGSPVASARDIDRPGTRIGVTAKSNTATALTRDLTQASVVRADTVQAGAAMLKSGEIDAYATNKPTLFEMSDHVPGSHVLDGRWGVEQMAFALPKGKDAGMPYVRRFVEKAKTDGTVNAAVARSGLRGAIDAKDAETGADPPHPAKN